MPSFRESQKCDTGFAVESTGAPSLQPVSSKGSKTGLLNVVELRRHLPAKRTATYTDYLHSLHEIRELKKEKIHDLLYGRDWFAEASPTLDPNSTAIVARTGLTGDQRRQKWQEERNEKLKNLQAKAEKDRASKTPCRVHRASPSKGETPFEREKIRLYLKPRTVTRAKSSYVLKRTYRDQFDEMADKKGMEVFDMFT